ncbi:MAG: hypothetical protein DI603_05390 [Roseateles depolymerans]|uniref:Uncharacterized protein n=1 Tax=Roseateles depolymerans TaxID=76731 RepID=A0A2W5DRB7_9BURK|nr:MAG: hypothetical protein DI603_05390 [Roseateles depolymerans]
MARDWQLLRYERFEPTTEWVGGYLRETDPVTLARAAKLASQHAGVPIEPDDFLHAAANGEIALRAVVHRSARVQREGGGVLCNAGTSNENIVPANAIPTLPLSACKALAATGRASWRTFDSFALHDGELQRFTSGRLADGEPDFVTVVDDCRVTGNHVHALADALKPPTALSAAQPSLASAERITESSAPESDETRRLRLLRELGGDIRWLRGKWDIKGIQALERRERAERRSRTSQKTIREDLKAAAESERNAKREGAAGPHWPR